MRDVLGILIPSLINFMPLIVIVSGWVKAFRRRENRSQWPSFDGELMASHLTSSAIVGREKMSDSATDYRARSSIPDALVGSPWK
jgi:hypothetical protein